MTEFNKVKTLLEKVQVNLPRAEVAKSHVRQHFRQDIHGAIEYLGTEFADMFADAISFKRGRTRGIAAVERPPQRPRLSDGNNELTRTPDGITMFFGVDVTDVGRTFTNQEMATLGPHGQAYVFEERERLGLARTTRGTRGNRGRGGGRGPNYTNRRVGAIEAAITDDVSGITHDTKLPPVVEQEPRVPNTPPPAGITGGQNTGSKGSHNGNGFGAGAYLT